MNYTISLNGNHKYASTYIRTFEDGTVQLVSYTTTVIEIDSDGWMTVNGLYTMTTIKHIGWFMRERGLTYQLAKRLYNDNLKFNVYTGEIK